MQPKPLSAGSIVAITLGAFGLLASGVTFSQLSDQSIAHESAIALVACLLVSLIAGFALVAGVLRNRVTPSTSRTISLVSSIVVCLSYLFPTVGNDIASINGATWLSQTYSTLLHGHATSMPDETRIGLIVFLVLWGIPVLFHTAALILGVTLRERASRAALLGLSLPPYFVWLTAFAVVFSYILASESKTHAGDAVVIVTALRSFRSGFWLLLGSMVSSAAASWSISNLEREEIQVVEKSSSSISFPFPRSRWLAIIGGVALVSGVGLGVWVTHRNTVPRKKIVTPSTPIPSSPIVRELKPIPAVSATTSAPPMTETDEGLEEELATDLPSHYESASVDWGPITLASRVVVDSAAVDSRQDEVAVGWIERGPRTLGDSAGHAVLSLKSGQLQHTGTFTHDPLEWIDRVGLQHNAKSSWSLVRDGRSHNADDTEPSVLLCNDRSVVLYREEVDPLSGVSQRLPVFDTQPSDCATLPLGNSQFARVTWIAHDVGHGLAGDSLRLLVNGVDTRWSIPLEMGAVHRARDPQKAIRAQTPDVLAAALTTKHNTILVFRRRNRLWWGVLDAQGHSRTSLSQLATLGGDVGKPRLLALSQGGALLYYADRAPKSASDPLPNAYKVHARIIDESGSVGSPASLPLDPDDEIEDAPTQPSEVRHEFAPAISELPDHSYLVAMTRGTLGSQPPITGQQTVYLRHFSADFSAIQRATHIVSDASDPRVVTHGWEFLVTVAAGRREERTLQAFGGAVSNE